MSTSTEPTRGGEPEHIGEILRTLALQPGDSWFVLRGDPCNWGRVLARIIKLAGRVDDMALIDYGTASEPRPPAPAPQAKPKRSRRRRAVRSDEAAE